MKIKNDFLKRQKKLLSAMEPDSVAILFTSHEQMRNRDNEYKFRQDSDFYYITGFDEADAIAVFVPSNKDAYLLFCQEKDARVEVWTGKRIGQQSAVSDYGVHKAYLINEAGNIIPELLKGKKSIYFNKGFSPDNQVCLNRWVQAISGKERASINMPTRFIDIGEITHEMRVYKDADEIAIMKKSAKITADAHSRAMRACRPGMYEYELEAELHYEYLKSGGQGLAFNTIVAGGENACTLHYTKNDQLLCDGDLVLVDSGVEYNFYAGDITRTYPVNGKFNPEQRAIYQAVLDVQMETIAQIRPGVTWIELEKIAEKVVTEQLLDLKILHGELHELLEKNAGKRFFIHHIGHWIGIDNHDVGRYKLDEGWRPLQPGMTLTVEPGIYIPFGSEGVDKKWWGIGVRIEDDILVTEEGYENMTNGVPKDIDEIEALMQRK